MKWLILSLALLLATPTTTHAAAHLQPSPLPVSDAAIAMGACSGFIAAVGAAVGATAGTGMPAGAIAILMCWITVGNHPELLGIGE